MDSINKQQPEKNREDLTGEEAAKMIKELCEKAKNCFFCTHPLQKGKFPTRPMSIQEIDDDGTIWFLSASDSHKNAEIATDPNVQLLFQGSTYADFLSLHGRAVITTDKGVIKKLWEPILKVWFTEGEDDPRITAIGFTPEEGYYWDNKHGNVVAFAKQIVGALTGKTLDDSIEGTLKP